MRATPSRAYSRPQRAVPTVMRVLVAPDKFKGTLSATQAAQAIAAGWRASRPHDELRLFPISDGGDGFGELLGQRLGAVEQVVNTVDAAHRPIRATWWWAAPHRTAIIESARVIGLAMLPRGRYHPFNLDTRGLGVVLQAAAALRPRHCVVGLGGSATNDAGFGMARVLGWRFLAADGSLIEQWPDLTKLARIVRPRPQLRFRSLAVAVDVANSLLGPRGATRVYGPQKGITPLDVQPAERCLRRLARVVNEQLSRGSCRELLPGSGAAGGLGFGLSCFVSGTLEPGFALFAQVTGFAEQVDWADLVVTGEGAIDRTTVSMGKGVGEVARLAHRRKKACLGLAGTVNVAAMRRSLFHRLYAIVPRLATAPEAMARAEHWLNQLAKQAAAKETRPSGRSGG